MNCIVRSRNPVGVAVSAGAIAFMLIYPARPSFMPLALRPVKRLAAARVPKLPDHLVKSFAAHAVNPKSRLLLTAVPTRSASKI